MGNPFVHIELNTDDTGKAKKFYKALFDWRLEDMKMGDGGDYVMLDVGKNAMMSGVGGGMMKKAMPDGPSHWLSYVLVDDVSKTVAKAAKLGAQIYVEKMEVPGMGWLGVLADPSGAVFGLWQPAAPAPPPPEPRQAAAKKPAAKKPAAKKPAAKKPAAKKPARKKR